MRPGEDSMPLETSTPQGLSWAIAWATFSGLRPPATIRCTPLGAEEKRARAAAQSKGTPVPPMAAPTFESIRIRSANPSRAMRSIWAAS